MSVKSAAPRHINMLVRIPAGLWLSSRSRPTTPPKAAARSKRPAMYRFKSCSILAPARASLRGIAKWKREGTVSQFERSELGELARARVDFAAFELDQSLNAESLHRKAAQNRAVDHGRAQRLLADASGRGQIS